MSEPPRGVPEDGAHITTNGEPYLTSQQVADFLGLSKRTIENWRLSGRGPPFRKMGFGKNGIVRYVEREVREWVDTEMRHEPAARTPSEEP